jgi:hypothetical protein
MLRTKCPCTLITQLNIFTQAPIYPLLPASTQLIHRRGHNNNFCRPCIGVFLSLVHCTVEVLENIGCIWVVSIFARRIAHRRNPMVILSPYSLVEGHNCFLNQFVEMPRRSIIVYFLSLSAKVDLNLSPFEISCSWPPSLYEARKSLHTVSEYCPLCICNMGWDIRGRRNVTLFL